MKIDPVKVVLFNLIQTGLDAIGSRIKVEADPDAIYLRTLTAFVTEMGMIEVYEMSDTESPVMTFPGEAVQSAATAIVIHMLTGVVARAVESDELSRV